MQFYKIYSVQSCNDTHTHSLYNQMGICILFERNIFLLFFKTLYSLRVGLQFLTNVYIITSHIYNLKTTVIIRIVSYKICILSRKDAFYMYYLTQECFVHYPNTFHFFYPYNNILITFVNNINIHLRTFSHTSTHILTKNIYLYSYKFNEPLHNVISIEKYNNMGISTIIS